MIKLAIIYGGMSTEHDISIKSANSIIEHINKEKYEIYPTYIDKQGIWYSSKEEKIENIIEYLKKMNVVFPVLHGLYGEDGTIQGMLEMLKIPYIGCNVLSSSVGMDKAFTKIIFEKAKIPQAKFIYTKHLKDDEYIYVDENLTEERVNIDKIADIVENKINYPVFVKPSNSGSSIGINKAKDRNHLVFAIKEAGKYDKKILIEQAIIGKEVECAVLGNDELGIEVSNVGEVISSEEFYSYDAKYVSTESKTIIPAKITEDQSKTVREYAKKAFTSIGGSGLSRIDLFIEGETGKVYINEINTMPGFTNISMYPMLMQELGYSYEEIIDKIILVAINK